MSVQSMEHVLIAVRNLDQTLSFYRGLFPDWTIRWEGKGDGGTRWVHFGAALDGAPYLSIYEAPQNQPPQAAAPAIEHFGFRVADLKGIVAAAQRAGLEPSDRAEDRDYRRVYFTDPDGHDLELVEKIT